MASRPELQWGHASPTEAKIVLVSAVHHAPANSGRAGQAVLRRRIPPNDASAGGSSEIHCVHRMRVGTGGVEATDAALTSMAADPARIAIPSLA